MMKQTKTWICPETKEAVEIPNLHRGCQIRLNQALLATLNEEDAATLLAYQEQHPIIVDVFCDEQQACWDRHLDQHIPYGWIEEIVPYAVCEHCQSILDLDEFDSGQHVCHHR